MHENRDRLVEDLSEWLRTTLESRDPTGLLDATTLFLAPNLAQALPEDSRDAGVADVIEALSVLVAVHWVGYRHVPKRGGPGLSAGLPGVAGRAPSGSTPPGPRACVRSSRRP